MADVERRDGMTFAIVSTEATGLRDEPHRPVLRASLNMRQHRLADRCIVAQITCDLGRQMQQLKACENELR